MDLKDPWPRALFPLAVRPSLMEGAGLGMFALVDIPAGVRIMEYAGKRIHYSELPEDYVHALTVHDTDFVIYPAIGGSGAEYINHSCEETCYFDEEFWLIAYKPIQAGDELSIDYQMTAYEGGILPFEEALRDYSCHCSSPKCRGTYAYIEDAVWFARFEEKVDAVAVVD